MSSADDAKQFEGVQDAYRKVADNNGQAAKRDFAKEGMIMGYSREDLEFAPTLGLGCGNPLSFAHLQEGETVIDLGCGNGFDCFLAGKSVGPTGHVIGVDMTPEMLQKGRALSRQRNESNVSFRLGEIEHLPAGDASADVIISNGVVCLCLDHQQVFREAFRVLKPGGRMAICDMVQHQELPDELKTAQGFNSWVAGAPSISSLNSAILSAGFVDVVIDPQEGSREFVKEWLPGSNAEEYVRAANVRARKPAARM